MKYETFEFFPYYKCGDDMCGHLKGAKGNVSKAFESWAKHMESVAKEMRRLAEITKGTDIGVQADTHMVMLENLDTKTERLLKKEKLVNVMKHDVPDEDL